MSLTRRSFLAGAGSGFSLLCLSACTPPAPGPTLAPNLPSPTGVPRPSKLLRSAWSTDPFSLGSVSYLPPGVTPAHRENLRQPVDNRVFFAGEAVADAPGTVRGALDSGRSTASSVYSVSTAGERVAVVGAGIAGAECARLMSLLGLDVVVLEARDRTGGRIRSEKLPDGSSAQLGAWKFGGESDSALLSELSRADISVEAVGSSVLLRDRTSPEQEIVDDEPTALPASNPVGASAVKDAIDWAMAQASDMPLETALMDSGAAATAESTDLGSFAGSQLLAAHLRSLAAGTGADAAQLSSWFAPDAAEENRDVVTGSLSDIVDSRLEGMETFLSTAVVGVSYDDDVVRLRLGTGESLSVDRVVITVPLGVLKSTAIEFTPLLPLEHRAAISALSMGSIEVVYVDFDESFWSSDAEAWSLLDASDLIPTWVNLLPATGRNALLGIIGGGPARAFSKMKNSDVEALVRRSLMPFVGA